MVIINEMPQAISDAFLRENYGIAKEYEEDYPEDSEWALLLARVSEEIRRLAKESEQSSKKLTNSIIELRESNKTLFAHLDDINESSEKNMQALRKVAKSASELREMTSNLENMVSICANRIFNPVRNGLRNGFYFLTGPREPAAILPKENQLAIEYNLEDTVFHADPTNPSSIDEKKKWGNLLKFCMVVGGLYVLYARAQRILCYLSTKE